MRANSGIACLATLALSTIWASSANSKVTFWPSNEASFTQPTASVADKGPYLTKTDIRVGNGELRLTITTEGEANLSLFHVYLDTDMDASTGYQPASRKAGDMGADYLIEGSVLHVWDGGVNHGAWNWKPTGPVSVSRGPQGEIQVSVPLEKLHLEDFSHLRILVETLTEKWESADTLPRKGIWDLSRIGSQSVDTNSRPPGASPPILTTKPAEAGYMEQGGQPSAHKSASLVRVSATFQGDALWIKAMTETEPDLVKYHVYIDVDLNASTGFRAAGAPPGVGGADFLCEGGFLYAWDGNQNQTAWTWRKVAPVTVTRGAEQELQIAIPLGPLNLQGKKQIQLLVETIDDNWKAEDVIPRDRPWLVKLPDRFW